MAKKKTPEQLADALIRAASEYGLRGDHETLRPADAAKWEAKKRLLARARSAVLRVLERGIDNDQEVYVVEDPGPSSDRRRAEPDDEIMQGSPVRDGIARRRLGPGW